MNAHVVTGKLFRRVSFWLCIFQTSFLLQLRASYQCQAQGTRSFHTTIWSPTPLGRNAMQMDGRITPGSHSSTETGRTILNIHEGDCKCDCKSPNTFQQPQLHIISARIPLAGPTCTQLGFCYFQHSDPAYILLDLYLKYFMFWGAGFLYFWVFFS